MLFSFGPINISITGLFLASGFLAAMFIIWRTGRKLGLPEEKLMDVCLISLALALLGGRIVSIVLNFDQFGFNPLKWLIFVYFPGFSLYASLFFAFLLLVFLSRTYRFNSLLVLDIGSLGAAAFLLFKDFADVLIKPNLLQIIPFVFRLALFLLLWLLFHHQVERGRVKKQAGLIAAVFLALNFSLEFALDFWHTSVIYWKGVHIERVLTGTIAGFALIFVYFRAKREKKVLIAGGSHGSYFRAKREKKVLIAGGSHGSYFRAKREKKVLIAGGSHGSYFRGLKQMIRFPKKILKPIQDFLARQEKKVKKELVELKKEDPFADTDRASDNAATDTDVREQEGHHRIETLRKELNRTLVLIRKSLTKIKIGKYGICEGCQKMIDTDRLSIVPTAEYCMRCEKKKLKIKN